MFGSALDVYEEIRASPGCDPGPAARPADRGQTVLVIDDDDETRLLLSLPVEAEGEEADAEQCVSDADDLVAERRSTRQLGYDLPDPEADRKRRQGRSPPGEVGPLARESGAPRCVDDVVPLLSRHRAQA